MTPQSPAPVAGDEDTRPASEQPVEAIGAGREEIARVIRDRAQIGGTDWQRNARGADINAEELADLIAALSPASLAGPELTVWYGKMPESNGRENWTAELRRVHPIDKWDRGFCFARSEYPGRVLYEADRVRWIIGERAERPDILAYDADAHSGYVEPASPARTPMGGWPEVTDQWAETYCELTGRDPDGQQVTFVDGGTVTTFRDVAKREIEAMLCAAPKSAVRTIATAEPAEARIRELEQWQFNAIRSARLHDENARELDARATAAEAQLARAVEGLERIAGQSGDAGEKVWSDRAWLNFREVARQTLAALQQEGE